MLLRRLAGPAPGRLPCLGAAGAGDVLDQVGRLLPRSAARARQTSVTPGRPETIEETAALVTAEGGRGIAVRTDHTVESAVEQVFARVRAEAGRLDVSW